MKTPLFVHIPKTAGTFLIEYFKVCGGIKIYGHNCLCDLENRSNYFTFAFIRNPYDWHVSRYAYFCRKHIEERGVSIDCDSGLFGKAFKHRFPTFKDYILWGHNNNIKNFWLFDRLKQMCFVDNEFEVDFIGSFENIEKSIHKILTINNITPKVSYKEFVGIADNKKYVNKSKHNIYTTYYDNELTSIIGKNEDFILSLMEESYRIRGF